MNIIIGNVTGTPVNDGLIGELSRAGFPAGSVISCVKYHPAGQSCSRSCGGYDCMAYLGETCEEMTPLRSPGSDVWGIGTNPDAGYDTCRFL